MRNLVYSPLAKNTGGGYRKGSVTERTQNEAPNGNAVKRDTTIGRIIDQKTTEDDDKDVAHEPDRRRG